MHVAAFLGRVKDNALTLSSNLRWLVVEELLLRFLFLEAVLFFSSPKLSFLRKCMQVPGTL